MRRWQVRKSMEKDWKEAGPDLLRTKANARALIKEDLPEADGWHARADTGDGFEKWIGPVSRAELLEAFDDWKPPEKSVAQWGRKGSDGKITAKGAVRCRVIEVKAHSGCTDHTDTTIALLEAAFPAGAFGGAFVCKQISGSSSWSTHAYGKAYDHSAYDANDKCTAWCLRMARENRMRDGEPDILLPVWQILGSQKGNAGNADGGGDWIGAFEWSNGGCDSSHEWHVHLSTGKSKPSGTPSCASKSGLPVPEDDPRGAADAEEEQP